MGRFYHNAKLLKTGGELVYASVNHQGRKSSAITALPMWANGTFRPARVRLSCGKTELLLRTHIVKKHGVHVCFGRNRFKVGQVGVGNDDFQ